MHAPTRQLSDFLAAHRAETALRVPEVAKHVAAPKRIQHVGPFALLKVGLPSRIVRISFTFNLDVPFDGCGSGALQPNLDKLPIAGQYFAEETPVETSMPLKVFLFEPAGRFSRMSSPSPSPQCMEDDMIHMFRSLASWWSQKLRSTMPRILSGDTNPPQKVQPLTSLLRQGLDLTPPQTYFLHEEEVPRAGARVTQYFSRARWMQGQVFTWLRAQKQTGRGEASSGLAFDRLVDKDGNEG